MPETVGPFAAGFRYEANEIAALRWVYATLVDSALLAYELVLPPLTQAEREQYYAESQTMAALFGIPREMLAGELAGLRRLLRIQLQSSMLTVSPAARHMAQQASSGAGLMAAAAVLVSRADYAVCFRRVCAKSFDLPYGEREERSAARAMRWLPRFIVTFRDASVSSDRTRRRRPSCDGKSPARAWRCD